MAYKNLEHDGASVNDLLTREEVKTVQAQTMIREKKEEDYLKSIAQVQYMNLENPALWDGEI